MTASIGQGQTVRTSRERHPSREGVGSEGSGQQRHPLLAGWWLVLWKMLATIAGFLTTGVLVPKLAEWLMGSVKR